MDFLLNEEQLAIRSSVSDLCSRFPEEYWRERDQKLEYPEEFVDALAKAGWLSVLVPEEYGGNGET